jgi:Uma2 family endonuclease
MTALRKQAMSVDEFLAWAERQPDRWELLDGIPTAMSPERVEHGDTKYRVARARRDYCEGPRPLPFRPRQRRDAHR